jgi:hypothetical protein
MKVAISKDGHRGMIFYSEADQSFMVFFPIGYVRDKIESYLSEEREFWIPESNEVLDDYRVDVAFPVENVCYFSLTLSCLHTKTGVWVHWEEKEGGE